MFLLILSFHVVECFPVPTLLDLVSSNIVFEITDRVAKTVIISKFSFHVKSNVQVFAYRFVTKFVLAKSGTVCSTK